jgi:hypothetical protein
MQTTVRQETFSKSKYTVRGAQERAKMFQEESINEIGTTGILICQEKAGLLLLNTHHEILESTNKRQGFKTS